MNDFTKEDLHQALAGFLMCFGSAIPPELRSAVRDRTHELAKQMERGGEPNVARLTRGLGDALAAVPQQRSR